MQEETGYVVDTKDVRFINSHISSSGTAGARHYMFYAEVCTHGITQEAVRYVVDFDNPQVFEIKLQPLPCLPIFPQS